MIENKILQEIKCFYEDDLLSIILFGSYVYLGKGKDIDILVIVRKYRLDNVIQEHVELFQKLLKVFNYRIIPDIHIFSIDDFLKNLKVGTFLTGLVLGYKIIYDVFGVEKFIKDFIRRLSSESKDIILVNRHGKFNLVKFAKIKSILLNWE